MSELARLASLVPAIANSHVLCLGDLMLDRFVYGQVERISPEAPIPVLRIEYEIAMLGGAGNVVRNLVALGARAEFVSAVGADGPGRELMRMVGQEAGVLPHLFAASGRRTTIKLRYVASGQQLLRADLEDTGPLPPAVASDLLSAALSAIDAANALVLSDYGKGVLADATIAQVIGRAKALGKPVIVDPKGLDFSRYRGADLITPNRHELGQAMHCPATTDAEIAAAARELISRCGIGAVLVTRGKDGMTLVGNSGVAHLPARAREVYDVSGAGDTVVAVVAAAIGAGASVLDAARLANVAAGIVVGKIGTATVHGHELVGALHTSDLLDSDAKVVPIEVAVDMAERWRRNGARIGFTNGCFDLLHPGHLALLRQARAECDRLIVGLNDDPSVARLKGAGRPIQSEAARALVLASLATVDLVVLFTDDTPIELIRKLRPDVLVKGADYRLDQVVGADLVQGFGGRVVLAELAPGHSTSGTIARIAR